MHADNGNKVINSKDIHESNVTVNKGEQSLMLIETAI